MTGTIAQIIIAAGTIAGVLWSFYARSDRLKELEQEFKELEQKVEGAVTIATCQAQHQRSAEDMKEVKTTMKSVVESLQGRPGETGLVSKMAEMNVLLKAIRDHQKNGG